MKTLLALALSSLVACSEPGASAGADVGGDGCTGSTCDTNDAAKPDSPEPACVPGERSCDGALVVSCLEDGSGFEPIQRCEGELVCSVGTCRPCVATQRRCTADGMVEACDLEGRWLPGQQCAVEGLACIAGTCRAPCVRDPKSNDNTGCDYWALDMDNHPLAQNGPYAIIVSNLFELPATVKVTRRDAPPSLPELVTEVLVPPGELEILELPNRNMGGAGIFWSAYRVESTVPIIAYQFNPLDNVDVFSNDATLLVPTNTFGSEYFVMSRFELQGSGTEPGVRIPYRSMFAVIASAERTNVTVRPTTYTQAGFGLNNMEAGESYTYTLDPYQVLNVKSQHNAGDLTGTLVTSDKPVAVFGGHEAALSSTVCCADHLEQQLYPVATWGTTYVATKSKPRQSEQDYWRIMAAEDGTTVSFSADVADSRQLARGEWFEFASRRDFVITADRPISVAQILASSYEVVIPSPYSDCTDTRVCATGYTCEVFDPEAGEDACFPPTCVPGTFTCPVGHVCTDFGGGLGACTPIGDPALIMLPPVRQFRTDYVFLAPNKYEEDYVNLVAPSAAFVMLDGTLVAAEEFKEIPGTVWKVARVRVADGVHRILADMPISVIAYGWDRDVSYGYPAGLNLVAE